MVDEAAAALVPGPGRHHRACHAGRAEFAGRPARGAGVRRAHRGRRADGRPELRRRPGVRAPPNTCSGADAGRACCCCPRAIAFVLVDAAADGVTVEPLKATDFSRPLARVVLDDAPAEVLSASRATRRRSRRDGAGRRGRRAGALDAADRDRVREGARAVRQADRQLPGDQAHVRRDAAALRAGRRWPRPTPPARPTDADDDQLSIAAAVAAAVGHRGREGQRQGLHPGARRHRHHLGARRAPVSASRVRHRAVPRRAVALAAPGRGADRSRACAANCTSTSASVERPAARDRRGGRRSRGAARGEAAGRARRDRPAGAALAAAVRPGRRARPSSC